jgi:eukaryotic translation initiation factor 2C
LKLPIFTARPDQVEDDIGICYQEAQKELRDQKIDLLLAILPDENGSLYGNVYDRSVVSSPSIIYICHA